jgi:hypothetical protein
MGGDAVADDSSDKVAPLIGGSDDHMRRDPHRDAVPACIEVLLLDLLCLLGGPAFPRR